MDFEIRITKETLEKWIQIYYKKYYALDVEVNLEIRTKHSSYDGDREVTATLTNNIEILGKAYPVSNEISKDEIENICRTILKETDYDLQLFYFNTTRRDINAYLTLQRKELSLQRENI